MLNIGVAPSPDLFSYPLPAFGVRPKRQRACLMGKLIYGEARQTSNSALTAESAFTLDCTIRDISEGGAKVTLGNARPLPAKFYLIVVKHCVAYYAEMVWRNYPARGLKFSETHPLDGELPQDLKFLRKLWGELYVRFGGITQ